MVGADHVLYEHDYILGLRGVRRGLKYVSPFMDELKTVSQVSLTKCNLNLLFSYIKDTKELEQCLRLLEKSNFQNKFGIMAEIPSTIICLEDFLRLGVSNVTVGINDLTTLLLGAYRTSEYYNCNHIAVYKAIEKIVNVIHNTGKIGVIFQNGFFCVAGTVWGKNPQVIVIFAYVVKRDIQI